MVSTETIRKMAFYIAIASFAFTIIRAISEYLILELTTLGAPLTYYLYSVLVSAIPYLFIGVIALIVSLQLREPELYEEENKKVKLNKIMRGDVKKYKVYVKNDKGNVVKVNFGDPNMEIKRDDPNRRKNFRARHNCDNPGPRWMRAVNGL